MGNAFLYGFGGGTGGTGAALTVNAPAGCTVTVSKDGKFKTKAAGSDGLAVFKGLSTGQWTVNMTDGAQTAPTRTADITADYAITMTFFSATIHVTYPEGSTCTATDGVTTLTAPDTSGTWDCVVPNAGTWSIGCTDGTNIAENEVSITEDGQSASITLAYTLFLVEKGVLKTDFSTTNSAFAVSQQDGYALFKTSGSGYFVAYTSEIDLTQYSSMEVEGTFTVQSGHSTSFYIGIWESSVTTPSSSNVIAKTTYKAGTSTYSIDISSYSGSYKVGIAAATSGYSEKVTRWALITDNEQRDYIYYTGNQYESLTGGWSFKQIGTTSTSYGSSIDSYSITVGASGSGKDSNRTYGVATGAAIDLTNASTLNIVVTSATISGSGGLRFGIDDTVDSGTWSGATAKQTISASTDTQRVSLDVSSITGSYYVWVGAYSNAGSGGSKVTFRSIYLC